MHQRMTPPISILAALALGAVGCSKPEDQGSTPAQENTYESSGSDYEEPMGESTADEEGEEFDAPYNEAGGTTEIDDDETAY